MPTPRLCPRGPCGNDIILDFEDAVDALVLTGFGFECITVAQLQDDLILA